MKCQHQLERDGHIKRDATWPGVKADQRERDKNRREANLYSTDAATASRTELEMYVRATKARRIEEKGAKNRRNVVRTRTRIF